MESTTMAVYATDEMLLHTQISAALASASTTVTDGTPIGLIAPDSNNLAGVKASAAAYKGIEGRHYDTVVVVSATRSEPFRKITICRPGICHSPLGKVKVNAQMREELCDEDDDIFIDDAGHFGDSGLAVQLPYLQSTLSDFSVVPVIMGDESISFCRELGEAIKEVIFNRRALVVASVDIVRATEGALVELREAVESGDIAALEQLLAREDELVLRGSGALMVMLIATRQRRGNRIKVLECTVPADDVPGALGGLVLNS